VVYLAKIAKVGCYQRLIEKKFKTGRERRRKKEANRTSHRYNRLPLLPSDPGGVQQELVVPACRGAKIEVWRLNANCKENISERLHCSSGSEQINSLKFSGKIAGIMLSLRSIG
jgi:hypothetical protein